ncbi:hypothetical protein CBR_g41778 [Chara braunii]|uniref:Uncharacterized protein n=1 Tax=Chara braunii TaxID=69332 RepID=A0A388LWL4_CHABU|nr:hypothetical protein CBR_g41778 [Chara braunii]|eukprot:GBG86714.1 hypothetical protein CBR_g41778 [Chara braunii]
MNRHRLSTFTLPSDVPVFWQSAVDTSLSFTTKHLDVSILSALPWGRWWQWQAYVALSFCLLEVAFHWAEPADRTVESEVPDDEVELLLVQAWTTSTEGDFMGIIFGEVRDDNLGSITDELLVFLVQLLDDLPLEIVSRCDERPGTATLTRSLEPHVLWSTCTELDEGSYYLSSRGVHLTVDVTDLSRWDPLVQRPEGQTSEEAQEEEEESEESTKEEERNDDPDYRESEDEVLGEAGSGEDNEEQEDDSEEEAGEEEATSTDSSEAAELTREEQEAEDQKQREKGSRTQDRHRGCRREILRSIWSLRGKKTREMEPPQPGPQQAAAAEEMDPPLNPLHPPVPPLRRDAGARPSSPVIIPSSP